MSRYRYTVLGELAGICLTRSKRLRYQQLLDIEFLVSLVDPAATYAPDWPYQTLRIRQPRTAGGQGSSRLPGRLVIAELVTLAEQLSSDANLRTHGWPEPLSNVADLARRFNVSGKTVLRWRRMGLVGWRFVGADRRRHILFAEGSVRRFLARHLEKVERAARFSRLNDAECERIVVRARALRAAGARSTQAICSAIARECQRSIETIRRVLKSHAATQQDEALNRATGEAERSIDIAIAAGYAGGRTIPELARALHRNEAQIREAIARVRVQALRKRQIQFVDHPDFRRPDADRLILSPVVSSPLRQLLTRSDSAALTRLPPFIAGLFRVPLLTRTGEVVLFRKMNYLKFKACRLIAALDSVRARPEQFTEIEQLLEAATQVRNDIAQANLRLVVNVARKHLAPGRDLLELISDGNISLLQAVDRFDCARGFKFSTYASWALVNNYARSLAAQRRHAERYRTGWEGVPPPVPPPALEPSHEMSDDEQDQLRRRAVNRMLASLDPRERAVISDRFGLGSDGKSHTLEEVGNRMGLSKERIRQLESCALAKLRDGFVTESAALCGA